MAEAYIESACEAYNNDSVVATAVALKAGPGVLKALIVVNESTAKRYLVFYDALAASVTVGTTPHVWNLCIPAQSDAGGGGFNVPIPPEGVKFSTGITIAATVTKGSNDAPSANDVGVNAAYH